MFQRLIRELRTMRRLMVWVAVLGGVTGGLIIAEASAIAHIVAGVYLGHWSYRTLVRGLGLLLLVVLARGLVAGFLETGSLNLSARIQSELRQRLLSRLFEAGPLAWNREHGGELINTVITGIDNLETFLARYVPQIAITALVPLVIGIRVLLSDWISAAILLITVPLIPFFMALIGRRAQVETDKRWAQLGRLGAHFLDLVQGLETLKLFGQSRRQTDALSQSAEQFRKSTMASLRLAFMSGMVLELLASLSMAMIAVAVGIRLVGAHLSFERAIFLLILIPDFYAPWRALGAKFHDGLNGLAAARTLYDWLDRPPLAEGVGSVKIAECGPWPIHLQHVGFRYSDRSPLVLRDVTATIEPGEALAVIGPSGSGKSTLLSLLLGFADPTEGEILVNRIPFRDLDRAWWRTQVAYINQSPYLFDGTIEDNLRLARPDADDRAVAEAIRAAHLDETLARFPEGTLTKVGENGMRLSGGERQRVALARAFLQAKPFIVLDEPAAHLDTRTEAVLTEAIRRLKTTSTVILITHRWKTLEAADRILLLIEGQVAEIGRPAVLSHPFFRQAERLAAQGEEAMVDALLG